MNPHNNEAPSPSLIELPPVAAEQSVIAEAHVEAAPLGAENASAERQISAPAAPPPAIIQLPAPLPVTQSSVQDDVSATTSNSSSKIIDDNDLIEKEWVNKAKEIVERNRDDPYKQSNELTVFKADYMKKHYDKTIKQST